jgi:hypothetical protein
VYKVSYTVGIFGYILLMLQFFEITKIFYDGAAVADWGIMLLSYGLYFGYVYGENTFHHAGLLITIPFNAL